MLINGARDKSRIPETIIFVELTHLEIRRAMGRMCNPIRVDDRASFITPTALGLCIHNEQDRTQFVGEKVDSVRIGEVKKKKRNHDQQ